MTTETLTTLAASILSLLASYLPGFSGWYESLEATRKRLVMLSLLLVVVVLIFASACTSLSNAVTCDQAGAWGLVKLFFYALVANQATYLISPRRSAGTDLEIADFQPAPTSQDPTHEQPSFPG